MEPGVARRCDGQPLRLAIAAYSPTEARLAKLLWFPGSH
jgi:hypothetical protein